MSKKSNKNNISFQLQQMILSVSNIQQESYVYCFVFFSFVPGYLN